MTEKQDVTKAVIERLTREAVIEIDSRAVLARGEIERQVTRTKAALEAAVEIAGSADLSGLMQHDSVAVGEALLYSVDRPHVDLRVGHYGVDLKTLFGETMPPGRYRVVVSLKRVGDLP